MIEQENALESAQYSTQVFGLLQGVVSDEGAEYYIIDVRGRCRRAMARGTPCMALLCMKSVHNTDI